MNPRTCKDCYETFSPSSRHLSCPKCRAVKRKLICECGEPKAPLSVLCQACRYKANEHPPEWRGNSTRHKKGYVLVRVPDHPNSVGGYVFEHRLVMEDFIGRSLFKFENVHHKNGVKDDNRLENLELWTTMQPSGQRAEDLLAYAQEIIQLYGGSFPTPTNFNTQA